jgi:predicted nicotinamide N-methyase
LSNTNNPLATDDKNGITMTAPDNSKATAEEEGIEEDDWSNIMTANGGFARHEEFEEIALPNGACLRIAFASSLSPLDMVDLSWGTNDATGHCIWTGARFFLEVLPELADYFIHRRVLELGSGTGLSGIAVALQNATKQIILTDSSESVLKLCKQNCELNKVTEQVAVQELHWGSTLEQTKLFDTVFATDVLYDIGSWLPLLKTVVMSIPAGGVFILSHVPRAALPVGESCSLEEYLIGTAKTEGLDLIKTIHPGDLGNEILRQEEMEEKGVAVFLFRRSRPACVVAVRQHIR